MPITDYATNDVPTAAGLNANLYAAALHYNTARLSVKAMTTTALPTNTISSNILTASANGAFGTIDGQSISLNDRIWVNNEATTSHNGPYTLTQVGDGSNPWKLTRTVDLDTDAEFLSGIVFYVRAGTTNGGKYFYVPLTTATGTLNTDAPTAARLAAALGLLTTDLSDYSTSGQTQFNTFIDTILTDADGNVLVGADGNVLTS